MRDRVPPNYRLPEAEIAQALVDVMGNDEGMELEDMAVEASSALRPYYYPPFRRGTYYLEDWGDEVYEFVYDNWDNLYSSAQAAASRR